MKGIILAGGSGTRLLPITKIITKQLLPVYDKPMIYYPLSTLMLAGIRDILIISTPEDVGKFEQLLEDGSKLGVKISYEIQKKPEGIAQALIIGKEFIDNQPCALILGDNIFYGSGLTEKLVIAANNAKNGVSTLFGYHVSDPERFGIMELSADMRILSLEEKPKYPKSNYCITGLYFYDCNAVQYAELIKPSSRGELEITSLNNIYLRKNQVVAQILGRGYAWFDTGTVDSLVSASDFVRNIEKCQGIIISSPEEVAYNKGWLSGDDLKEKIKEYGKSEYGKHLNSVLFNKIIR